MPSISKLMADCSEIIFEKPSLRRILGRIWAQNVGDSIAFFESQTPPLVDLVITGDECQIDLIHHLPSSGKMVTCFSALNLSWVVGHFQMFPIQAVALKRQTYNPSAASRISIRLTGLRTRLQGMFIWLHYFIPAACWMRNPGCMPGSSSPFPIRINGGLFSL